MLNEKIGICILNFFSSKHIKRLLSEFSRDEVNFPIYIVDNSNDKKEANNLRSIARQSSLEVNVVTLKRNIGYYKGNYVGVSFLLRNYNCQKVLIVNPDVSSNSWNKVINLLSNSITKKDDFMVGPRIIVPNSKLVSTPLLNLSLCGELAYNFFYPVSYLIYKVIQRRKSLKSGRVFAVEGSAYMVDVLKYIQIKTYFKNIFLYGEERIFGILAKKFKWNIYYLGNEESAIIYHFHSPMIPSTKTDIFYYNSIRERIKMFYDNNFYSNLVILSARYKYFVKHLVVLALKFFRKK